MTSYVHFLQSEIASIRSAPIQDGHLYFATDAETIAYDLDNNRYWLNSQNTLYNTTAYWSEQITFIPDEGQFIIYSDHNQVDGKDIPGIKIGDGKAYGVDLPFISDQFALSSDLLTHINDTTAHVTQEERNAWNNKVRCYVEDDNLTFTTN